MAYWISILTEACIFSIMALGLNVIWGWAGDFDLALYGYVALGVYLTIAMTTGPATAPTQYILGWHLPYLLAAVVAVVMVLPIAATVGAIALRNLREIYFAITTLGVISVLYVIVQVYTPLFNGFNGIAGLVTPMARTLHLSYGNYQYFLLGFCAVLLLVVVWCSQRLSASPYGRAIRSIRDNEQAAAAFGRSIFRAKLTAYVLGAGPCSVRRNPVRRLPWSLQPLRVGTAGDPHPLRRPCWSGDAETCAAWWLARSSSTSGSSRLTRYLPNVGATRSSGPRCARS